MKTIKVYEVGVFDIDFTKEEFLANLERKLKVKNDYLLKWKKANENQFLLEYRNKNLRIFRRKILATEIYGEFTANNQVRLVIQLNLMMSINVILYSSIMVLFVVPSIGGGNFFNYLMGTLVFTFLIASIILISWSEVVFHKKWIKNEWKEILDYDSR